MTWQFYLISRDLDYVRKYADHVVLIDGKVLTQEHRRKSMTVLLLNRYLQIWRCGMIEFFTAWWSYGFMRNAFIAILIITPLFGILGTMIVNNKMAFFSDALGHSALTGIALGVVDGSCRYDLIHDYFCSNFCIITKLYQQ